MDTLENFDQFKVFCLARTPEIGKEVCSYSRKYTECNIEKCIRLKKNSENSFLPSLKVDEKGRIIELIICNNISTTLKENMPKMITLKRKILGKKDIIERRYIQKKSQI